MNKIAVNSLLLASAIGLTACSNSDDSTVQSDGGAVFMHGVADVGYIYADGTRPYGTIKYRDISGVLALEPGDYSVSATQLDLDDPASSVTILNKASFTVNELELGLHVFTGSYEDNSVSLTSLSLTADTADTADIVIKVANLNPGLGEVDIYFHDDTSGFDIMTAKPDATIAEMGSSASISLSSAEQRLIVANPINDEIIFDSGLKTLVDSQNQIIVLTESTSATEDIAAVYYRVTAVELWNSNDGLTDVRVLNALNSDAISAVSASDLFSVDPASDVTSASLSVGAISDYVSLPSNAYEVIFNHTSGDIQSVFSLVSGYKMTFAVVGDASDSNDIEVVKLEDDQQNIFTESKISFTHLGYDEEQSKIYDVHFLRDGVSSDLDGRIPEVSGLEYKETTTFSKNKASYSVVVTKSGTTTSLPSIQLDLTDGNNHQLAIIQDGTTYKVCDFSEGVVVNTCD